jgi:multidrug transporter EmrE-like cation transporter
MTTELWAVAMVIVAALIGSVGAIMLKKASGAFKFNLFAILKNKSLILGFLCYGASSLLFIPALKGGELSVLYPLVGTMYIWVSLLSVKFLGEKMNRFKWLGVISIILGVVFIGIGSAK